MAPGRETARRALPALLVALAALAAQAPAIRRVLVWDDVLLFARDDLYVNPARLAEALTSPLGKETPYWRPVATTSFLLEWFVHGGVAEGFRLTAALLHAAASALAFLLLDRLTGRRAVAVFAALVFAWHPVHVETVTWISARFDLLAGVLTLGALLAAGDGSGGRARLVGVGALCALAVMTKESGVALPIVAVLWAAAGAAPTPGDALAAVLARRRVVIAGAIGLAVALFLRFEAIGWIPPAESPAAGLIDRVTTVGRAFATSVFAIVWFWGGVAPVHDPPRLVFGVDWLGWVGLVFLALAVTCTVLALRRRPRSGLLAAAFLVSLAPTMQIVPVAFAGGADSADRFLYVPTFLGVALIADLATADLRAGALRVRSLATFGVALLAALLAYRSWVVTRWNDPVLLWEWAQVKAPRSLYVRGQLARALVDSGDLTKAEAVARALADDDPIPLAKILVRRGRADEAAAVLDRSLAGRSWNTEARLLRAELRLGSGQVESALDEFVAVAAAESAKPRYEPLRPAALAGAAQASALLGRTVAAEEHLRQAEAEASADDERAWLAIARAGFALGRTDAGLAAAGRALAAGADEETVIRTEVAGLRDAGRPQDLIARLRRLDAIRPRDAVVLDELGYTLWEAGDAEGAERTLRGSLDADPEFGWARFHLAVLLERTGRADESRAERERARTDAKARNDAELIRRLDAWGDGRGGGGGGDADRPRPGR